MSLARRPSPIARRDLAVVVPTLAVLSAAWSFCADAAWAVTFKCEVRLAAAAIRPEHVDQNWVQHSRVNEINLLAPAAGAQIAQGTPLTFRWTPGDFLDYDVYIYPGVAIVDENYARVFYQLPPGTTSASLPCPAVCGNFDQFGFEALPPGEYIWAVVGSTQVGYVESEERRLTILATCPADVDDGSGTGTPDGGVTIDDLVYYIQIYGEGGIEADLDDGSGTGTPDGGVTIDDLVNFIAHFEGGC